jgi:mannan endo-1,4-beta-mannosidase
MKKHVALAAAALVAAGASLFVAVQPASAAVGLRVSGRNIVEANGSTFLMRGVSHAHVWYETQTSAFANIKSLGANTVRVVLGSGQRWGPSNVADVVSLCKQNRLICILEVHDTTGFGEEGAAATLDQAATYWISQANALIGQENYIVINIGNEPFGNNASVSATWATATSNAITRLRNAGLDHLIMADAPMWGQDWQGIMRDNARTVFNADPDRNTVFSIHMYGVYDTAAEINAYFDAFATAGLPLVVGEFGHNHSDGNPDEDTIMAQAQARGIGYIGWSWSGNSGGVEYLDMVTSFNVSQLTSWGQRIFNGANGIRATAREATIYSGQSQPPTSGPPSSRPPTSQPPSSRPPSSQTPPASSSPPVTRGCSAAYSVTGQWPGGFQGEVRVTAGSAAVTGWTVTWAFANGQSVNQAWGATVTSSGSSVSARNMAYNGSLGAGASTTFGFIGSWNGTNSSPTLSCTAT